MVTRLNSQWTELEEGLQSVEVAESDMIPGLPRGTKFSDLPDDLREVMFEQSLSTIILLDMVKSLGLSDKTVLIIE